MQQEGDAEGAKKHFETSLKVFEDVHGEDALKKHPHIAILKHNLGRAYQSSGDLTAARENLESSLDISKKVYGDEAKHPGIGHTLLGLEELDRKEGRITEAEYRKKAAKKILDVMFKERRGTYYYCLVHFLLCSPDEMKFRNVFGIIIILGYNNNSAGRREKDFFQTSNKDSNAMECVEKKCPK